MTRRGVAYITTFALSLLLALATGYSEIYFAVFLCGFIGLFAFLSVLWGRRAVRIGHTLSFHAVMQGDSATVRIHWLAGACLPVAVKIGLLYPAGQAQSVVDYFFFSRQSVTDTPLPCPHRGRWPVGVYDAHCSDIFGLFCLRLSQGNRPFAPLYLTVYPLLVDIPGLPFNPPEVIDAENPLQNADQGDTFSDTRMYRDGDTMKRIHWKLSVRTRELHTRQYEAPAVQTTLIVLDSTVMPGESAETVMGYADMAASAVASLALYYLSGNYIVRINLTGYVGEFGSSSLLVRSAEEYEESYAALAVAPFTADTRPRDQALLNAIYPTTNALDNVRKLYVVTRRPDTAMIDMLSSLCSPRMNAALIYLEPAYSPARQAITADGLHLIPITCPRDIIDRLGDGI